MIVVDEVVHSFSDTGVDLDEAPPGYELTRVYFESPTLTADSDVDSVAQGLRDRVNRMSSDLDLRVRLAAFAWLGDQTEIHDGVLPWDLLVRGFPFEGSRVSLAAMQGIFKPKILPEVPLAIRTSPSDPYHDEVGDGGTLRYAYRKDSPSHRDNRGLRLALERRTPLVYLYGISEGKYVPAWPVLIIGDDPGSRFFTIQVEDRARELVVADGSSAAVLPVDLGGEARRSYITRVFLARLHQRSFREQVLRAYRAQCALCRLRHEELLDAAHIVGDREPDGEPVIPNGLSLCKLHHAAFDGHFLAVTPDYRVEVRPSILAEEDGPMLLHGLKAMHGKAIQLPRDPAHRPDRDRLARRYDRFLLAG